MTCRDPTAGTSGTWFRTHHLSLPNQPGRRLGKEASAWKTACRCSLQESAVRPGLALRLADPARGAHSPALPRAESWAGSRAPSPHRRSGGSRTAVGQSSEPGLGREDAAQGLWHVHHTFTSQPGARPDVACHPSSALAVPRPTHPHARGLARPSESDGAPVRPRPPHHLPLQRVLLSSLPAPRAVTAGCYGDG